MSARKIPAPFQRPSITVGNYFVKREWRWVDPDKVAVDDIVPAVGKVSLVDSFTYTNDDGGGYIRVAGGENNEFLFPVGQQIWAFTRAAYQG